MNIIFQLFLFYKQVLGLRIFWYSTSKHSYHSQIYWRDKWFTVFIARLFCYSVNYHRYDANILIII